MGLWEIGCEDERLMNFAQNRFLWRALVLALLILQVLLAERFSYRYLYFQILNLHLYGSEEWKELNTVKKAWI